MYIYIVVQEHILLEELTAQRWQEGSMATTAAMGWTHHSLSHTDRLSGLCVHSHSIQGHLYHLTQQLQTPLMRFTTQIYCKVRD
jgi:hypothetical protein